MAITFGQAVGRQVAQARTRRGWTQQQLGDQLRRTDPDTTLNRAAVAKIESGVRGVTIEEVVLLAVALNAPPVALLVPLGTEEWVRLPDGTEVDMLRALGWFCGEHPLPDHEDGWVEGVQPVEMFRELPEQYAELQAADALVEEVAAGGSPWEDDREEVLPKMRERAEARVRDLHATLRRIQAARLRVPPVETTLVDRMERLGLDVGWLRRGTFEEV